MMYMTPELLTRIRSADDDIAEAAAEEWDRQGEQYRSRLKELRARPDLPRGVQRLLRRDVLHDAKILSVAGDRGNRFSLFLELSGAMDEANKYVELQYRLVGGVGKGRVLVEHPELAGDGQAFGWWLYDEIDITEGKVEAYTHSILMTGGWEMRLTFYALKWRRLDFLIPHRNGQGVVDGKEIENLRAMKHVLGG